MVLSQVICRATDIPLFEDLRLAPFPARCVLEMRSSLIKTTCCRCGASGTSRWHITMRVLTVQVLGILLLGYQGAATPIAAGNYDDFGPGSSAVGRVSVKHNTTAVTSLRSYRL
jgi:hypothetical protein